MTAREHYIARRRRSAGFTLLEVILASSVGLIMVIGAVSLVFMFERTNERLDRRFRESTDLQRTRLVMSRAFSAMLMSQNSRPQTPAGVAAAPTDGTGAAAGAAGARGAEGSGGAAGTGATGSAASTLLNRATTATAGASGGKSASNTTRAAGSSGATAAGADPNKPGASGAAGAAGTAGGAQGPPLPPRILLGAGPPFPPAMLGPPPQSEAGRKVAEKRMMAPQRLEIVLSASPVPSTGLRSQIAAAAASQPTLFDEPERAAERGAGAAAGAAAPGTVGEGEGDEDLAETPVKAVRGAFELRPLVDITPDGVRVPRMMSNGGPVWELWWVPLPPRDPDAPEESEEEFADRLGRAVQSGSLDPPYKIASNIAWIEWRMFQERERKRMFSAAMWSELPAYVEVEMETVGGMTGNWLFEVSADQGPEVPPPAAADVAGDDPATGSKQEGAAGQGAKGTGTQGQGTTGKSGEKGGK